MAKAYWIARITVNDPERYKDYVATARPAFERHGARFLARGGAFHDLEGPARERNVVIEFDSVEEAIACYNSPEYLEAAAIRKECADGELVVVEGV